MRRDKARFKSISLVFSVVTSLLATLHSANTQARDECDTCIAYAGSFTSLSGDPCTSPVGLCTHGTLVGDFPSRYDFTFQTLQSANDPTDPSKFVYTGNSVMTAADGSGIMCTNDTGVIHIPTDGSAASFVTKAIVDHGTHKYRHMRGGFVATGSLMFETGNAVGNYSGVLCPRDDRH
jgi:hypothetical protein